MTVETPGGREAARLRKALELRHELTCEQARDQLPALVEAELAGEDVDATPAYSAVLRHLDGCEECVARYAELADDLSALIGASSSLPAEHPPPPTFFAPARQSDNVVLRVLSGLARRFELALRPPAFSPSVATLGSGPHVTLFTDSLPEVEGTPLVAVSLNVEGRTAELLVAIREATVAARWQVQVTVEQTVHTAATDERGIARFSDLPVESLQQLTIACAEIRED